MTVDVTHWLTGAGVPLNAVANPITLEPILAGPPPGGLDPLIIEPGGASARATYRAMRHAVFVDRQGLFPDHDRDEVDDDPATIVLVARDRHDSSILGGVRVHPHRDNGGIGWWRGSRLVVDAPRAGLRTGSRLVRAATTLASGAGALRFDATVQRDKRRFFERLGWRSIGRKMVAGLDHELMLAPCDRFDRLLVTHKRPLGRLLSGLHLGGAGFIGDDAAPVPSTSLVAACDAIVPAMVERDPVWAGWCGVLVNINDLAAMGAVPLGFLDAVAGRDERHVGRVMAGMRAASEAYGVPVLGGHTQLSAPAALTITAIGATTSPVTAGGGRPGDDIRVIADLAGGWRPGYTGQQWDSTSHRSPEELRRLVGTLTRHRPAAAKDVSMAGLVGSLAALAEASATGAEIVMTALPVPGAAAMADWLTCFPGFALVTADRPGAPDPDAGPATVATIGRLVRGDGVRLRWPDGRSTPAVTGVATGLGPATGWGP